MSYFISNEKYNNDPEWKRLLWLRVVNFVFDKKTKEGESLENIIDYLLKIRNKYFSSTEQSPKESINYGCAAVFTTSTNSNS